jgi:hypothetical protein
MLHFFVLVHPAHPDLYFLPWLFCKCTRRPEISILLMCAQRLSLKGGCSTRSRSAPAISTSSMTSSSFRSRIFRVPIWESVLNYLNLWPKKNICLNEAVSTSAAVSSSLTPNEISIDLRKKITAMYGQYITENGASVDYEALERSKEFSEYCDLTLSLRNVDVAPLPEAEKTAFFINIYNSLLIHAIAKLGAPGDLLSRLRLYAIASYSEFM